jgi:protein-S-isoprenylcysteine O-methyltransferase Ste14
MPRIQIWAVTLVLTLVGAGLVVAVHSLSIRFLYPSIGDGIYFVVLGAGWAAALLIGRVVRWLNGG